MSLKAIRALVEPEFNIVNETILFHLRSQIPLIQEVGEHLIASGGKRIRPLVALLAAKACNYTGQDHTCLATIIEYLHTATLLHDDVVDESEQRRGQPTANIIWDNATSVLVGDFLYSRAFQMMVTLNSFPMLKVLSEASNTIIEGEVSQLINKHNVKYSEVEYFKVIYSKTAKLFEAAAQLGGQLAGIPVNQEMALQDYGRHLGMAFQLVDDMLDYTASAEVLGKNLGDDLAEGKMTLPLLYALQHASEKDRTIIIRAIETGSREALSDIQQAIAASGAIEYTLNTAQKEILKAKQALELLPDSIYLNALNQLADFTIKRSH